MVGSFHFPPVNFITSKEPGDERCIFAISGVLCDIDTGFIDAGDDGRVFDIAIVIKVCADDITDF